MSIQNEVPLVSESQGSRSMYFRAFIVIILALHGFVLSIESTETVLFDPNQNGGVRSEQPCLRPCVENAKPKKCYYNFTVELYHTLSLACYNCPVNISHCYLPDCIAADGMDKTVTVVNRKLPGSSIHACKNDEIIVDVLNMADPETTSIHWHGVLQHNHQYMDGVPMVTQCPIQPMTSFRYRFPVPDAGSFFWHSHSGLQRGNGLFGALIVRQEGDEKTNKYDYDLPEHAIIVTDWHNVSTVEQFTELHFARPYLDVQSMLVNGRGHYATITSPDGQTYQTPLSEFYVQKGKRYRFRLIDTGVECGIEVSIEGHKLEIIATDGNPVEPMVVDAVTIFTGERYDFVLTANNTVNNYWMKFRGLGICYTATTQTYQVAILRYEGAAAVDPLGTPSYDFTRAKGLIFNPVDVTNETMAGAITTLRSTRPNDATVQRRPDKKFTFRYNFRVMNDTIYNRPIYAHNMSTDLFHVAHLIALFNDIYFHTPPSPLLSQYRSVPQSTLCDPESLKKQGKNCTVDFCDCTYLIKVPLRAVIQMLFIDDGFPNNVGHPIHLHGHNFRVLAVGSFPPQNSSTLEEADLNAKRIEKLVNENRLPYKLDRAVLKDTVKVPNHGYAVIRFYTDNPGFWFLHCHIESHVPLGMSLVVQAGHQKHFPKPPSNFPKCGNF